MTTLTRGANTSIATLPTTIAVTGTKPGTVDLFVFQLGPDRKVRRDEDLVFFNNPTSPEGAVSLVAPGQVLLNLNSIPSSIERVAVAVSVDDAVPGPLSAVPALAVSLTQAGSAPVTAVAEGLTTERSAVLMEVYRRGAEWKARNISAGWNTGLAALVTEHGVSVDDAPPPAAPAPPPPVPTSPGPAPYPTAPPPASPAAPFGGQPTYAPPAAPPAYPPAAAAAPSINLSKGKIDLAKGKKVSVAKTALAVASVSWSSATDYDVYALVLFRDGHVETASQFGTKGNGKRFTPVVGNGAIKHCGDIGRAAGKVGRALEKIEIRLNDNIVCVVPVAYSAQSNGTGSFFRYKVTLAVDNGAGDIVTVDARNAHRNDRIYTCVPAIVWNRPHGVEIEAVELYSAPNSENRPLLNSNGSLVMDAGPVNAYK